MQDHVLYLGKWVPRKHFRVKIYTFNNVQKLVNSYEEYEDHLRTGLWYAQKNDIPNHSRKRGKARGNS